MNNQDSLLSIAKDEPFLEYESPLRPINIPFWPLKVEMDTDDQQFPDQVAFACKLCKKNFLSSANLQSHEESGCVATASEIENSRRTYVCEMCMRSFKRAEHLKRHEQSHAGSKPFKCDECGSTFRRNEHLKRHMFSHLDVKPFSCQVCDRGFNRREHLKRHEKTHKEFSELKDFQDLKA